MAYFFELPMITDLTEDQHMALDEINPIAISGGEIIERNIILFWRHMMNIDLGKSSVLLLSSSNSIIDYVGNEDIRSSTIFRLRDFPFIKIKNAKLWKVDEIIIEEIQNLTYSTLQEIKKYTDTVSYGADFNQQLYAKIVIEDKIQNSFPKNIHYNLQQNFRSSYHILNFVKGVLPNFFIPQSALDELEEKRLGIKPMLFITNDDFEKEIEKIVEIINQFKSDTHNIAILLPFGNSEYDYKQSVDNYYNKLLGKGITCSKYYSEMRGDDIEIKNIHITTFALSRGLEFDTVIIPQIDKMIENTNNSKSLINQEDYYIAFTRTKMHLYLFSSDKLEFIDNSICEIEYLNITVKKSSNCVRRLLTSIINYIWEVQIVRRLRGIK